MPHDRQLVRLPACPPPLPAGVGILAVAAVSALAALSWFFTAGQFAVAEPAVVRAHGSSGLRSGLDEACGTGARRCPPAAAVAALDGLAVKGRAAKDNYDREAFGQAWLDVDRNGCDTRNDILRRDLSGVVFTEGSKCRVAAGTFHEPYTGQPVDFRRGSGKQQGSPDRPRRGLG